MSTATTEIDAATAAPASDDKGEKKKRKMTDEAKAKRKLKRREKHLEKLRAAGGWE